MNYIYSLEEVIVVSMILLLRIHYRRQIFIGAN